MLFTGLLILIDLPFRHPTCPCPNVNREVLEGVGSQSPLFSLLDLLSGGTVSNFSVLAMGVYPYITAQIILQLLMPIIPALQRRAEEDPRQARKWMETLDLHPGRADGGPERRRSDPALPAVRPVRRSCANRSVLNLSTLTMIITMTAGTMFAIWLGDLISEFGLRNQGLSLIIFSGIVSQMPSNFASVLADEQSRLVVLIALVLVTLGTIVGNRLRPGRAAQRTGDVSRAARWQPHVDAGQGHPAADGQHGRHDPADLRPIPDHPAGVDRPVLHRLRQYAVVQNIAAWAQLTFGGGSPSYWVLYFLFVVGFTFFYTDVLFSQQNYGENLKRAGAQIPGVTRGAATQKYLTRVLRRITLPGAVFLGFIAVLPFLLTLFMPAGASGSGLLAVSSAGLLIVVGVVRDVYRSIEAELKLRGYDFAVLVR